MTLDPEALERIRSTSGLRLDRDGRFWHEGTLVEHPRVIAMLHRGLARAADGRPPVRFGTTWAYLEVEGTLFQARRVLCAASAAEADRLQSARVRLDDGSEEPLPLAPGAVRLGEDGVLQVRVKAAGEWARCIPEAHAALGVFVGEAGEGLVLRTVAGDIALGTARAASGGGLDGP